MNRQKNMTVRRRGLLSLYIYIEDFKNLLVRNYWTDFNIIHQKYSFADPLKDCLSHDDLFKNVAARVADIFSFYIYIEKKIKIFLSETTGPISI